MSRATPPPPPHQPLSSAERHLIRTLRTPTAVQRWLNALAYNAEADSLVRSMKPYKRDAAVERLDKVATTIQRLGRTMDIRVPRTAPAPPREGKIDTSSDGERAGGMLPPLAPKPSS